MGLLVDGKWTDKWYDTKETGGKFVRSEAQWRDWITADGKPAEGRERGFKAEPGRYLPFARHVTSEVIALDSGDLMMMFRLEGLAFETADPIHLNDWHEKLNGT